MKIAKILYNDELLNNCSYIEYPDDIFIKEGYDIIVNDNDMLKIASIVNLDVSRNDLTGNCSNFVRIATKKDREQNKKNMKESNEALMFAKEKSLELGLDMHFISSYYTFDHKQLFLLYVANNRIDFRELAKILAQKYKTRIELRQIGVRDRAKSVGGLGPCGLFLCCSSFLTEFASVSINMAKNQFLALNPTKINGLCGRLLCCLNYEDDVYTELKKGLPNIGNLIDTVEGMGKVVEVDVFNRKVKAEVKNKGIVEIIIND